MLSGAKGRGVAHVAGAIGRVCRVNHGSDVPQRNAPRVQVGVDVVGNLLWRPIPSGVVADDVGLPDEGLFRLGGPSEADGAQFCEVCLVIGIGSSRNRSATKQGSASHHGDGKSGHASEVRAFDSLPFFLASGESRSTC